MDKLRIILAEDHQTVREGVKLLVNSQSDMEVVGEASNGSEAIKAVQKLQPDIRREWRRLQGLTCTFAVSPGMRA